MKKKKKIDCYYECWCVKRQQPPWDTHTHIITRGSETERERARSSSSSSSSASSEHPVNYWGEEEEEGSPAAHIHPSHFHSIAPLEEEDEKVALGRSLLSIGFIALSASDPCAEIAVRRLWWEP